MPNFCCVVGCSNRSNREKHKSFFNIPKIITNQGEQTTNLSQERRQCWLERINRKDWSPNNSRICSDHFVSGKPSKLYDTDDPDWAPSVNMGYDLSINGNSITEAMENEEKIISISEDNVNDEQYSSEPLDDFSTNSIVSSESFEMIPVAEDGLCDRQVTMDEAMAQECACTNAWKYTFLEKSTFPSFQDFQNVFEQYQEMTFSVYRISDCNRVETANFKRKAKLNSSLKYASVTFCCALFGHQKSRGKLLNNTQNNRSAYCPSYVKVTSSSRDQQLRIVEINLLHNHKLDQESYERFLQAKKLQQEITKDELLDALSSVEVIIKDEQGCSSPPHNDLSSGQKQQLSSNVTSCISSTLIKMETEEFCKWISILGDMLSKMELDAKSEACREKRRRSSKSCPTQNKKRIRQLETCDTDKEVCNFCKKHEPPKRVCPTRVIEWIECDSCKKWYHRACLPAISNTKNYKCSNCKSINPG